MHAFVQVDATHAVPPDELEDELDDELEELDGVHVCAEHVALCWEQFAHVTPPPPHASSSLPDAQRPFESQQPLTHPAGMHVDVLVSSELASSAPDVPVPLS